MAKYVSFEESKSYQVTHIPIIKVYDLIYALQKLKNKTQDDIIKNLIRFQK